MTCHVLHAGDGYTYLTNSVASGDVERSAHEPLVDYYTAQGNPPGRWVGSGIAELGVSGQVTEEHMLALFGEGLHPEANRLVTDAIAGGATYRQALDGVRLGRRFYQFTEPTIPLVTALRSAYEAFERDEHRRPSVPERRELKVRVATTLLTDRDSGVVPEPAVVRRYLTDELGRARQPVAGFDLVFSPVKSVSVLWGLADRDVREVVEEVHEGAWRAALAYGEREAGYTRIGAGGIAQIDTHGFVATAFDHRDSRAGDPDLHTHLAVANRVLGVDGGWRTLDSQQVHRVAVSMSEVYNAHIEQGLTERLGASWVEVSKGADRRGVRELAEMPQELIRGFSRRRTQVEAGYDQLVADYVARYGHTPPRSVQMRLAQQATLAGRPDKQELRSLAEQVTDWRRAGQAMLRGRDLDAVLAAVTPSPAVVPQPLTAAEVSTLAGRVVDVVSEHRATWTVYHVRAEAIRQVKPLTFTRAADRDEAIEQVVDAALGGTSFELGLTPPPGPTLLRRADGESVYQRHGSTRYTSHAILDAETRLLAAGREAGPRVPAPAVRVEIARYEAHSGRELNPGQRQLVEQFLSCGRALAVGIGPPGAGKSTVMRAVRAGWETTGGRVLGLAPSAAAASVLGDELGVRADTVHRLLFQHERGGGVGGGVDVRAGDMLLVDEAGMAGTRTLDRLQALAEERGAVLRLVGDYRQLAAVEAGGALRLIHHEHGGTELTEVHRFTDPAEAAAVLQLRVGDPAAIAFYTAQQRLHGGTRAAVLDELYRAWQTDTAAGTVSIMISDAADTARELSERAQTDRRATGRAETVGVELHDGTRAGVGDRVITRRNARRLAVLGGRDYVKNGDLWDVLHRSEDGGLTVRHARHGGRITLPADYVAEHLELGYAATIHRAQGLTVQTSRTYLSPTATRETALVGLSRGTQANHAYLDTETVLGTDELDTLPGDLFYRHRNHDPLHAALATIIGREGGQRSATEQLREALDAPHRLDTVVPQYLHALSVYRGPDAAADAAGWVGQALPEHAGGVVADPAWPALAATLLELRDAGADPVALLTIRAGQRPLRDDPSAPARSVAQVLHHRLAPDLPAAGGLAGRPAGLPGWVPTPPAVDPDQAPELAELGAWLREHAEAIAARVPQLGARAADTMPAWTAHLGPRPHDPIARDRWIDHAGQVAAYRERFAIPDTDAELLPGGDHGEAARARTWVEHHLATTPATTPRATEPAAIEPAAGEPAAGEPAQRAPREQEFASTEAAVQAAHDAVREMERRTRLAAQRRQVTAAWRGRPHGRLSRPQLDIALVRARRRAATTARDRTETARRRDALAPQVAAGQGPRAVEVQARVGELTRRAELAARHAQLLREWREVLDRTSRAAEQAAHRDHEAGNLSWWDTVRHPDLRDRLTAEAAELRTQTARGQAAAADLARQARAVQDQAAAEHAAAVHAAEQRVRLRDVTTPLDPTLAHGAQLFAERAAELTQREALREPVPLADQNLIDVQARTALQHRDRDLQEARTRDQRDVAHLEGRVQQLDQTLVAAEHTVNELLAEQQLRDAMDPHQQIIESQLRITANLDQAAAVQERVPEPHLYQPVHQPPEIGRDGPSLGR